MKITEIEKHLRNLYDGILTRAKIKKLAKKIALLSVYWKTQIKQDQEAHKLTEKDVFLTLFGDSFTKEFESPLSCLEDFLKKHINKFIDNIYIISPYESRTNNEYNITNHFKVNEKLGTWQNIVNISKGGNLMLDFEFNHISVYNKWFKNYLRKDPLFKNYFIYNERDWSYDDVTRPTNTALFHDFLDYRNKPQKLLTTFSPKEVDLNFRNYEVLLKSIDILCSYIYYGAKTIKLSSVEYLWKRPNSSSFNLFETHEIVKLWKMVVNYVSDEANLVAETTSRIKDSLSYFDKSENEADLIYNSSLAALVISTFKKENSTKLSIWSKRLIDSPNTTFFNYLEDNKGINLKALSKIISHDEIDELVEETIKKNGSILYRTKSNREKPYKLKINFKTILENKEDSLETNLNRFIAAHSILLSLIGVPALYYNSLFGSDVNNEKFNFNKLNATLLNPNSKENKTFKKLMKMVSIRKTCDAFSPYAKQEVNELSEKIFSLTRIGKTSSIFYALNVSSEEIKINIKEGIDVYTGENCTGIVKTMKPYEFLWIRTETNNNIF